MGRKAMDALGEQNKKSKRQPVPFTYIDDGRNTSLFPGNGVRNSKSIPTFGSTTGQYFPSVPGLHSFPESVLVFPFSV
jgi:hypothetical protein